jgi:hypothetical protein
MNKTIIYIFVMLLIVSNVFAIGLGAKNEQIVAEGNKTVELFVINTEHEKTKVNIGVLGEDFGIEVIPGTMDIEKNDEMKTFTVALDFDKIKNHSIKIFISEIIENKGQISASANIVYRLPIIEPGKDKENEQKMQVSPLIASSSSFEGPPNGTQKPVAEEQETAMQQLSGAASKGNIFKFDVGKDEEKKLIFAGAIIAAFIILLNIFFIKRKTPLEKYIINSRSNGKSDDEIRNNLKDAGWNEWILERHLKK